MNKKKLFSAVLLSFFFVEESKAQDSYSIDAFRFSQSQLQGSARTLGFAGAQTALGADLGSLSSNPAGLGLYRKSEYAFAPNLTIVGTDSKANGSAGTSDSRVVFNMANMGVAFSGLRDDIVESKWRGGTFALGLTRTINFQNAFSYNGVNDKSSLADYITYKANQNGYKWQNYDKNNIAGILDLAYGTYVFSPVYIEEDSAYSPDRYFNLVPASGNPKFTQAESVVERGGENEWTAGYGGNVDNRFFFGASFSLVTLKYDRARSYKEDLQYSPQVAALNNIMTSIYTDDNLRVRGTGVNLNVGVAAKINDFLRAGLSFKTPTIMGIRETYNASMSATYANVTIANQPDYAYKVANPQINDYTYYSPFKATGGLAFFAGKVGFLSADVEYVNYATANIGGSNKSYYVSSNKAIDTDYNSVFNIKVGGEVRANILRFRAGYALFPTPWKENILDINRGVRSSDMQSFTLGFGVRTNEFFLDLAYARSTYTSNYSPYYTGDTASDMKVVTNNALNNVTVGFGFFF